MDSRLLRKRKFFIHIVSTIHLSRHARCSVCPHWYFFRNYSRLRVSENKRKTCFPFVECEQSQLEIKAIMQEKNDERSKSRLKLAWTMPRKEEVEYYSTDYERSSSAGLPLDFVAWLVQEPTGRKNMLPMTIGIKIVKFNFV